MDLALEFLRIVMPGQLNVSALNPRVETGPGEGKQKQLLQVPITTEMPEECRPDNKWIGMRLKIPHEFATRVRNRKERGLGREFQRPEDEIWMHVAPTAAQIEAYKKPKETGKGKD